MRGELTRWTVGALMAGLFAMGACDQGCRGMEQDPQLAAVTSERDALRKQLDELQAQLTATRKELDQLRLQLAEQTPKEAAPQERVRQTQGRAGRPTGLPEGVPRTKRELDLREQREANTGASHFNR